MVALACAVGAPTAHAEPREVKITNIGLHVGGGPNDARTKLPFLRAIAARFDDFRACYDRFAGGAHGTFGVDLLVPRGGGHPSTSNPRTAMSGPDFRACVVKAFEAVVFERPARGTTKLSYALDFERSSH